MNKKRKIDRQRKENETGLEREDIVFMCEREERERDTARETERDIQRDREIENI